MRRRHAHGPTRQRLTRRHEFWLYLSSAALLLSGVGWLCAHYWLRSNTPFGAVANPAEVWWLRLHGAAVVGFLMAFGALLPAHVVKNWRMGANRTSGGSTVALVALLALTGYGLYYVVGDNVRAWISVVHWGVGLLSSAALVLHVVLGKRRVARVRAHRIRRFDVEQPLEHPIRAGLQQR